MFLIKFLKQIRQKPKEVRSRYAFVFASVFTGIVALVWVMVVLPNKQILNNSKMTQENSTTSFWGDLFSQSKNQLASAIAVFEEEKEKNSKNNPEIIENSAHSVKNQVPKSNLETKPSTANQVDIVKNDSVESEKSTTTTANTSEVFSEEKEVFENRNQKQELVEVQIVTVKSNNKKETEEEKTTSEIEEVP